MAVLTLALPVAGCSATSTVPSKVSSSSTPASAPAGAAAGRVAPTSCAYAVRRDVLPVWARGGFNEPSPSGYPYIVGAKGDLVGVIFGYPLAEPSGSDRSNKILWVSRFPLTAPVTTPVTLKIRAQLDGSTETASIEVPGPGPSIIDVPHAGCWHLTLTWAQHTDTLDLRYEPA